MSASTQPLFRSLRRTAMQEEARAWLDALTSGGCDEAAFIRAVQATFDAAPDAAWEMLSLLDQYHRRGKIASELFQELKLRFERRILYAEENQERVEPPSAPCAPDGAAVDGASMDGTPVEGAPMDGAPIDDATAVLAATVLSQPPVLSAARSERRVAPPQMRSAPRGEQAPAAARPSTAPIGTPARSFSSKTPSVGDVLRGRYRLQALLGRGGMGTVFEAVDAYRADLAPASQRLAVKVLHTEVTERPDLLTELRREVQHLQSLSHPNVVRVHEFDRDGDLAFFTMELLQGAQLSRVLDARRHRPLERSLALAIIRDVGAALGHAHSRHVIHGDLKPQNIFLTAEGEVRVLDFGAAQTLAREPWISDFESTQHIQVATPAFASCQLLEGLRADVRDDLYGFACVAYMLLAGEHPFQGRTALDARTRRMRPRRPAGLGFSQWRALRAGLEWERERRPSDVLTWLQRLDLRAAAHRLPLLSALTTPPPKRRDLTPAGAAGILLLALLAGALVATLARRAPPPAASSWNAARWSAEIGAALGRAQAWIAGAMDAVRAGRVLPNREARAAAAPSPPAAIAHTAGVAEAPISVAPPPAEPVDSTPTRIALASDTLELAPYDAIARVMVRRSGNLHGNLSFKWWTEAGSAKAGDDFVPVDPRTERIAEGKESLKLLVPVVSDPVRASAKSFYVVIGELGTGASLGARTRTEVVIPATN